MGCDTRRFRSTLKKKKIETLDQLRLGIANRSGKGRGKYEKELLLDSIARFLEPINPCYYEKCHSYSTAYYCNCIREKNPGQCKEYKAHKERSEKYFTGLERNRPGRQVRQLKRLCKTCIESNKKYNRIPLFWLKASGSWGGMWRMIISQNALNKGWVNNLIQLDNLNFELWLNPYIILPRLYDDELLINNIKELPELPNFGQSEPLGHLKYLYQRVEYKKEHINKFKSVIEDAITDRVRETLIYI